MLATMESHATSRIIAQANDMAGTGAEQIEVATIRQRDIHYGNDGDSNSKIGDAQKRLSRENNEKIDRLEEEKK